MLLRLRDQAQQALSRQGLLVAPHQPLAPTTQQSPNNETQNDFNAVDRSGQLMRKGAEGSFRYIQQPISHFDGTTPAAPRRANSSRSSMLFSESIFAPSMFVPDQSSQPPQHRQNGESSSGINSHSIIGDVNLGLTVTATPSPDYTHPYPQPDNCPSNNGQAFNEPLPPSLMQVDADLYQPMGQAQGMDKQLCSPPQAGNLGPYYGDDAFEAFANYMNVDASISSSDRSYPITQPGSHLEQDAYPAGLPALFPTSDFDVTFDMRTLTGEENGASMLPQDLEAWLTILPDSRYFGFSDAAAVKEPS